MTEEDAKYKLGFEAGRLFEKLTRGEEETFTKILHRENQDFAETTAEGCDYDVTVLESCDPAYVEMVFTPKANRPAPTPPTLTVVTGGVT